MVSIYWIALPFLMFLLLTVYALRLCYLEEQAALKEIHDEIKRAQSMRPAHGKPTLVKDADHENP